VQEKFKEPVTDNEVFIPPEEEKFDFEEYVAPPEERLPIFDCASLHILIRIYDVRGEFRDNVYYCEMCQQNATRPIDEGVLHCNQCNYDICPSCSVNFQCQEVHEMQCMKGHVMFKTLDILGITNSPYFYQDNVFYCHVCKKSSDCTKNGAFHCDACNYDVCALCFVTNMNSFPSR